MKKSIIIMSTLLLQSIVSSEEADSRNTPPEKLNVVICGSSTVWGKGLLDNSFVEPVDDYLKNVLSHTMLPSQMTYFQNGKKFNPEIFKNPKQYKRQGRILKGVGASVEFDLSGDELAVCQTIRRTKSWGKMAVYADGKKIGSFVNKNNTLGSDNEVLEGDGKRKDFELKRCFTYNHKATMDGKELKAELHTLAKYMTKSPFFYYPDGLECLVTRKYSESKPAKVVHSLLFKKAPAKGAKIKVAYDFGETVCHTKCTVGESSDDQQIESPFGIGNVSHDPAHPTKISSGLDYRRINKDAFWIHRFSSSKKRRIKIEIEGGENPYFVINFATNRYHNLMNAGIGGWTAHLALKDKYLRNYKHACKAFKPDIFFIALGGNDDWAEKERLVRREIKNVTEDELKNISSLELHSAKMAAENNYTVVKNTGVIESITPFSLVSPQLKGAKVKPGCFVRIGNYTGDNDSVAVRAIEKFDAEKGEITWSKPLSVKDVFLIEKLDDLTGSEIAVRELKYYSKNIRELIKRVKKINPEVQIVLLNVYNTNYFTRQIWGYPELQKIIASENKNVYALNAAKILQDWQNSNVTGKNFLELEANGSKEYTLPWEGHLQGYKVLVNGKNVYGKDCYVLSGRLWGRNPKSKGKALEFEGDYHRGSYVKRNQKLVFVKNVPRTGIVRVEKADKRWSGDYAHPNKYGIKVIGDACAKKIDEIKK